MLLQDGHKANVDTGLLLLPTDPVPSVMTQQYHYTTISLYYYTTIRLYELVYPVHLVYPVSLAKSLEPYVSK